MNLENSGDSTGFEPMTSAMRVQCSNQLSYEVTQLRAGQFVGLLALAGQFKHLLMSLKISGDSTGFEPMTYPVPVQCSNQLSYEVIELRAGQFVGLMFSRFHVYETIA